jgi:hypothetical protein
MALAYKAELEAIDPSVDYLMTLYLSPDLTPEEVRAAHKAGIVGVKSYPRGVTTNSEGGIESYEVYYSVFEAMQEVGMVLNLHGEVPSDAATVRPLHLANIQRLRLLCNIERLRDQRRTCLPAAPPLAARSLPAPAHRARTRDDARRGRLRQVAR